MEVGADYSRVQPHSRRNALAPRLIPPTLWHDTDRLIRLINLEDPPFIKHERIE